MSLTWKLHGDGKKIAAGDVVSTDERLSWPRTIHAVLVHNQTRKQIAESRGLVGRRWEEYYGMRFRECLDCLALEYGFVMEKRT